MKTIFYRCPICGNIMLRISDTTTIPVCCGHEMQKLQPATTDGKTEYHVPEIRCCQDGDITVNIGSSEHPMSGEHYIQFIYLQTEHGGQIQYLKPGMKPTAKFRTCDKAVAAFAYCNIHGLWSKTVDTCPCSC